ncbi:hypothetical protein ACFSQ7_48245 [Paenibacillus rhizoplanae]
MVDLSEYRGIFLEELEDQLQLIEDEVLRLEQAGGDGRRNPAVLPGGPYP